MRPRPNKRDFIVSEATRLFYERGTGLGVDTLVEEIGVAKMTIYKHFRTKDDLIVACLRYVDGRYRERLQAGIVEDADPIEKILGIFDSLGDWFVKPNFRGCAFVNAAVEIADPSHPARQAVLDHKLRTREWVSQLVDECGIVDSSFVTRQIVQLMEGAVTSAFVENDPTAALVARRTAEQVLWFARDRQNNAIGSSRAD